MAASCLPEEAATRMPIFLFRATKHRECRAFLFYCKNQKLGTPYFLWYKLHSCFKLDGNHVGATFRLLGAVFGFLGPDTDTPSQVKVS
jgi:hypothetical protein